MSSTTPPVRGGCRPSVKGRTLATAVFFLLPLLTHGSHAERFQNASGSASSGATLFTTTTMATGVDQADASNFLRELRETVARGFASMPASLRRKMLEAEVRPECSVALLKFVRAFLNFEPWALRLFDASGKYPTGLFQGSRVDLGAFDECLETVVHDNYGNVLTRGQYCNLLIYSKNGTATEAAILAVTDVLHPRMKYFSNYFTAKDIPLVRMAICFTEDCNQQDLQALVNVVNPPLVRLKVSNCVTADPEPWTNAQIGIVIFLCVLLVVVMAATLVDYSVDRLPKKMQEYRALMNVAKAFSMTSNTRILFTVADKSNVNQYALQFLHGMRFLCLGHIMICHCGQTISDNWCGAFAVLVSFLKKICMA
ncbi:nose resistant to fluoxetine protein 6-like [Dermacentor variabilis]|uniref:nose resistant to fluoxetine protein 6-like n=1 Tax=Dermacentor variabilis TaxID=34621 RepID=UPI003F5B3AFA